MFRDIGVKIKILAVILTWLGIMGSVGGGIVLMMSDQLVIGILVALIGSLAAWLGSFLLYGFGELIANTTEIKEEMARLRRPFNQE